MAFYLLCVGCGIYFLVNSSFFDPLPPIKTALCGSSLLERMDKYCFWCGETNKSEATTCKRCGRSV